MTSEKGLSYFLFFGFFCLVFGVVLYSLLRDNIEGGNFYAIWLLTLNITTLVMYAVDWLLSKYGKK